MTVIHKFIKSEILLTKILLHHNINKKMTKLNAMNGKAA